MFVQQVFVLICFIILQTIQVEAVISASKIRRTQSLSSRAGQQTIPEIPINTKSTSARSSSSSISSSSHHLNTAETEPLDTTLRRQSNSLLASESEQQALIERSNHAEIISGASINLNEAAHVTHGAHLDPLRDGVLARVRRIIQRYGVGFAVGSAIGAGGYVLGNHFAHNITESPMQSTTVATTTTTEQTDHSDDVDN